MKILSHIFFRYLLDRFYSGKKLLNVSLLTPDSKVFENQYKEERYKIIRQLGEEGRRNMSKLMELDVNYLNRRIHDAKTEKEAAYMRGRIVQNVFYHAAIDLVSNVENKKLAQKNDE